MEEIRENNNPLKGVGMDELLEVYSQEDAQSLVKLFNDHSGEGQVIVDGLLEMLEKYPDEENLECLLHSTYYMMGKLEESKKIVSKMIDRNPGSLEWHCELGKIYQEMGENERAVEEFKLAQDIDHYIPFYYTSFGASLLAIGETRQARDVYHREIECFENGAVVPDPGLMDGVFKQVIQLDTVLSHEDIRKDIELYERFRQGSAGVGISTEKLRGKNKIMPNDPCPCGSGKKYKKCCGRNR